LTRFLVDETLSAMIDLDVINDAAAAAAALDPVRAKILAALAQPGSSTTVATALGLPRQKINYHLRVLETHDLVRLVEERPRRGLKERVMVATAKAYVVSPAALGVSDADLARTDRLSSRYLIAIGARLVHEVAALVRGADLAGKTLATLSIDTEIRFASAAERSAFTAELTREVTRLAARYHDETAPGGRWHRLVVAAHPRPGRSVEPLPVPQQSDLPAGRRRDV
jgi:DNA-binding transcriptional ArsR family regulator